MSASAVLKSPACRNGSWCKQFGFGVDFGKLCEINQRFLHTRRSRLAEHDFPKWTFAKHCPRSNPSFSGVLARMWGQNYDTGRKTQRKVARLARWSYEVIGNRGPWSQPTLAYWGQTKKKERRDKLERAARLKGFWDLRKWLWQKGGEILLPGM